MTRFDVLCDAQYCGLKMVIYRQSIAFEKRRGSVGREKQRVIFIIHVYEREIINTSFMKYEWFTLENRPCFMYVYFC